MIILLLILLTSAGYAVAFYFTNLSLWFYFLWVPCSFVLGILTVLLGIAVCFFYFMHTDPKGKFRHHLLHQVTGLILWILRLKIEYIGKENVPNDAFVCYANHKSDIDPVALYYGLHRICSAIGKKSLFSLPVIKQCQKAFGAISLDRDNDREAAKSIVLAIKSIRSGLSMIIFPEGGIKSRETEEMVDLRAGAYKLITKTDALLLPATIIGSSKIKGRKHFKKIKIKIIFHQPISKETYSSMNTNEIGTMVQEIINRGVHDYQG